MPSRPTFTLPEGVELELGSDTLNVKFDGDVHLKTTLGRKLGRVEATGDVRVDLERVTGTIISGGCLTVSGEIAAELLSGRVVEIGRTDVRCRAIAASERIVVGQSSLKVDAIIAPEIVLDPNAHGRVTVIESHNERGPSKVKGGFSIADYEDMIGGADEFLSSRGLSRLGSPDAETVTVHDDEDVDDPESLSVDDIEPLATSGDSALDAKLDDAVARAVACYDTDAPPPAIEDLQRLVSSRDYGQLRDGITGVWNALLSYHQKKGVRPHHQVTHAFNVIHGLVTR